MAKVGCADSTSLVQPGFSLVRKSAIAVHYCATCARVPELDSDI